MSCQRSRLRRHQERLEDGLGFPETQAPAPEDATAVTVTFNSNVPNGFGFRGVITLLFPE